MTEESFAWVPKYSRRRAEKTSLRVISCPKQVSFMAGLMNVPDRAETYYLPEDAKKIEVHKDTKIPNAATFIIQKEDHTLGNLLRM